jgi:hypothetical protein
VEIESSLLHLIVRDPITRDFIIGDFTNLICCSVTLPARKCTEAHHREIYRCLKLW